MLSKDKTKAKIVRYEIKKIFINENIRIDEFIFFSEDSPLFMFTEIDEKIAKFKNSIQNLNHIKRYMELYDMSIVEMSELLGVSPASIYRMVATNKIQLHIKLHIELLDRYHRLQAKMKDKIDLILNS